MLGLFNKNKKNKTCSNCKFYVIESVQSNRMEDINLGLCASKDVREEAVPFGQNEQGFYRWDWPNKLAYGPISFSPNFSCKNHEYKK